MPWWPVDNWAIVLIPRMAVLVSLSKLDSCTHSCTFCASIGVQCYISTSIKNQVQKIERKVGMEYQKEDKQW